MIYEKLFKLQNEIGAIAKTEKNPFFKSNYFSINGLLEQLQPLLEKHGLLILQPLTTLDGRPAIGTEVIEAETGESHKSVTFLPEVADSQKMGSAITYYRRYALQSLLLLQASDDDGNAGSGAVAKKETVSRNCTFCKKDFTPAPSWSKDVMCKDCKPPFEDKVK